MQITADVSKILKTFQRDLTFIFDVLSESLFGFASYLVFQAAEDVVLQQSLRKRSSVTIRNYAETFQATHDYNMEYKYLIKYLPCRKQKFVTHLASLKSTLTRKREVPQPHVLIFFSISSTFSISSATANIAISRGKVFRDNPKKFLFRIFIYKAW